MCACVRVCARACVAACVCCSKCVWNVCLCVCVCDCARVSVCFRCLCRFVCGGAVCALVDRFLSYMRHRTHTDTRTRKDTRTHTRAPEVSHTNATRHPRMPPRAKVTGQTLELLHFSRSVARGNGVVCRTCNFFSQIHACPTLSVRICVLARRPIQPLFARTQAHTHARVRMRARAQLTARAYEPKSAALNCLNV